MRRSRKVRTRIFVACEGESENAFRAWLQDLCDKHELNLHLEGVRMKGGDPLALVQQTLERRRRSMRSAGVGHRHSLLLIDTDRLDDGSVRSRQAITMAEGAKLVLIRQVPCFEGVVLRLIEGPESAVAQSAREAMARLCRCWPEYRKPMTRHQIAARFSLADLQRLAAVDGQIRWLLEILGLLQPR